MRRASPNLFGAGVQACIADPAVRFGGDRAVVARWVKFYRDHRAILDSDIIHLRRRMAVDWDGLAACQPAAAGARLAIVYNL